MNATIERGKRYSEDDLRVIYGQDQIEKCKVWDPTTNRWNRDGIKASVNNGLGSTDWVRMGSSRLPLDVAQLRQQPFRGTAAKDSQ